MSMRDLKVEKTIVEYIWIGGSGQDIRGKSRVLDEEITSVKQLPVWNYDGSSTGQAITESSEIMLKPERIYNHPVRGAPHLICLCSGWNIDGTPSLGNFRYLAEKVFKECDKENDTWFGIEQEYILYKVASANHKYPIGWGKNGYNAPQGLYYCGVGSGMIFGREVVEKHMLACINAGIQIAGINAEVFPGQWEYQVGICKGIRMCDDLWVSRYLLQLVSEGDEMIADFRPKPEEGDWNGSGCHTNFSTNATRDPKTGWETFMLYCDRMKTFHNEAMSLYGTGNEKRMTGKHETANYDEFTYGVGARGCSVRIGNDAKRDGCGYMEDRRPSSNIDPYVSVAALADICCNNGKYIKEMVEAFKVFKDNKKFTFQE